MNAKMRLLVLPSLLAIAIGPLFAAPAPTTPLSAKLTAVFPAAPFLPTLLYQTVVIDDLDAYIRLQSQINALIKAQTGIYNLRHIWIGDSVGENTAAMFEASQYASATAMNDLETNLEANQQIAALYAQLKAIRHPGPSVLYKTLRYDGIMDAGAVLNLTLSCSDDDAVKAADNLKATLVAAGYNSVKVNLLHAVAGRTTLTHMIVLSLSNRAYLTDLIDATTDKALLKDWYIMVAKFAPYMQTATYHDVTD